MSENKNNNEKLDEMKEYGQGVLKDNEVTIYLISIIGEIEGHECLPSNTKTTKYEHVLPRLAEIEDDKNIDGVLLIINTVGGDVESGLAIAEMVASLSKPTLSLVLGGSHSIGIQRLACRSAYSVCRYIRTDFPCRQRGEWYRMHEAYDERSTDAWHS